MRLACIIATLILTASTTLPAQAQNLFAPYEGRTMILKGKGFSSGKSYTIKDEIVPCGTSESGLCYGLRPITNNNYAINFDGGDRGQEQIHLSVSDGKLVAHMKRVRPNGDIDDAAPLKIRLRK